LRSQNALINDNSFELLIRNNNTSIRPGHYILKPGMTNKDILRMLKSGYQVPVNVTFNYARTNEDFADAIAKQLMFSSDDLKAYLKSEDSLSEYGMTPITIKSMFIPNTYEFYWTSTPKKFLDKMFDEYNKFWDDYRLNKAEEIGLTQLQVSILASIVQAEQSVNTSEQPIIAGLYINRLKKGIPLQADPTVLYAIQDFGRKRLLRSDLTIDSPFNTYKYAGLPPGPINLPNSKALDAVLNYQKSDYIFMCAKDDFSGFHYFSSTLGQHQAYARRYQKALSKKGIKR
jgi:UPF0755 protein